MTIYLSSPDVGAHEEELVLDALRSGWVAPLGPHVDAFEEEVARRTDVAHAVALSSGTAALHLALLAWGVGPGDVVVTSTMTFAATANAIVYTGADPFFVDCDPVTGNIDVDLLEKSLAQLRAAGRSVPVIVPVDLLGKCADYAPLIEIADRYGAAVLADAAESLGASYRGRPAGAWGGAAVLSFNGNKIMTTSGGGMLLTDRKELADRVRHLATQARQPVPHYQHEEIGYNYRLSNILAAIGRAQLHRLDEMIARRRDLRRRYAAAFADIDGVEIFGSPGDRDDNCWLTAILVDADRTGWNPSELSSALKDKNIESRPLWKPMHLQPVFAGCAATINGSAQGLFERGLALPSGSVLSHEQIVLVESTIGEFLERAR